MEDPGLTVIDLKPSLLVALDISRSGGQHYSRENEVVERKADGSLKAKWTTKKSVNDEAEFSAGTKLQGQCKRAAGKLGKHIYIGIIAPADSIDQIRSFRQKWRDKIDAFNAKSQYSKIKFIVLVFKINSENREALEALLTELRQELGNLEDAYRSLEPESIRNVLVRLEGFTKLLPDRVAFTIDQAIKEARKKANTVSRRVKKIERIEAKIAQIAGPDVDVDKELETLKSAPLTMDIKRRVVSLSKLAAAKQGAVDALEKSKKTINAAPIRLARFVVRQPNETIELDRSAELLGARIAERFADRRR